MVNQANLAYRHLYHRHIWLSHLLMSFLLLLGNGASLEIAVSILISDSLFFCIHITDV